MIICSGCEKKPKDFFSCDHCSEADDFQDENNQWCANCCVDLDGFELCPKCHKIYKEKLDVIDTIDKYIQKSWRELGIGTLAKIAHDVDNHIISYVLDKTITTKEAVKIVATLKQKSNGEISSIEYVIRNLSSENIVITVSLYDHGKSITDLKNRLFKSLKVKNSALKAARTTLTDKFAEQLKSYDTHISNIESILSKWENK